MRYYGVVQYEEGLLIMEWPGGRDHEMITNNSNRGGTLESRLKRVSRVFLYLSQRLIKYC